MSESDVESILREIRERVLSQQQLAGDEAASSAAPRSTIGNQGNGTSEVGHSREVVRPTESRVAAENLALINSYLTTTARAWDRLPPLVSNRSGAAARLELWLKGKMKRATRWYAWEQVNFNAAVHHAIRDLLPVLAAYEQELRKLQTRCADQQVEFEEYQAEASARLAEIRIELRELRDGIGRTHVELEAEREDAEAQRRKSQAQQTAMEAQKAELNARIAELVNELRERDGRLLDEQRVTFKQISLETTEAAVLEDRARRKTEALLAELINRVEKLEKG